MGKLRKSHSELDRLIKEDRATFEEGDATEDTSDDEMARSLEDFLRESSKSFTPQKQVYGTDNRVQKSEFADNELRKKIGLRS